MASGERCSRGRAPGRSAPKTTGGTKSGQQISSREEIPSREVGRVRSCAEQKAIGALGQDLLSSSSPSLTWVRKTISLPGRSGASRTSRTLNP
jgi:hypothetical protein